MLPTVLFFEAFLPATRKGVSSAGGFCHGLREEGLVGSTRIIGVNEIILVNHSKYSTARLGLNIGLRCAPHYGHDHSALRCE